MKIIETVRTETIISWKESFFKNFPKNIHQTTVSKSPKYCGNTKKCGFTIDNLIVLKKHVHNQDIELIFSKGVENRLYNWKLF